MVSIIKDLSILRKFLFINLIVFIVIGILTIVYLKSIQPGLIKKKTSNHIRVIDNTIDHIKRLDIQFNEEDIKQFLLSTRFLFQNLDRVIFIDAQNNYLRDALIVITVYFFMAIFSVSSWCLLGKYLRNFAISENFIKNFNYTMSFLLIVCVIMFYV